MHRRYFIAGSFALLAVPLEAQQSLLNAPAGTSVFASDGALVGTLRGRPREAGSLIRLFTNPKRSGVFRRIDEDVIIDVPAERLQFTARGIILPADTQTLRSRLKYRARENEAGRVRLTR